VVKVKPNFTPLQNGGNWAGPAAVARETKWDSKSAPKSVLQWRSYYYHYSSSKRLGTTFTVSKQSTLPSSPWLSKAFCVLGFCIPLQLWAGVLLPSAADILQFLTGLPSFAKHPIFPNLLSYDFISSVVSSCCLFREGRVYSGRCQYPNCIASLVGWLMNKASEASERQRSQPNCCTIPASLGLKNLIKNLRQNSHCLGRVPKQLLEARVTAKTTSSVFFSLLLLVLGIYLC
jgi:hypothetical protein